MEPSQAAIFGVEVTPQGESQHVKSVWAGLRTQCECHVQTMTSFPFHCLAGMQLMANETPY